MSKPYDFREPTNWAEDVAAFDQRRLDDGRVIVLHGECPRCGHFMDVEIPIAAQTGGLMVTTEKDEQALTRTSRRRAAAPAAFPKIARCNCQMDHAGRPKEIPDGCGAFGALQVG